MARTPKDAGTDSELTDENVADYLRRHRDFLVRHPQLLQVLTPPDRFNEQPDEGGAEIVDLQGAMVNRLQQDLARAKLNQDALIQSARSNMSSQTQIHDAVLALVEGRDLDHFIHMATQTSPVPGSTVSPRPCLQFHWRRKLPSASNFWTRLNRRSMT